MEATVFWLVLIGSSLFALFMHVSKFHEPRETEEQLRKRLAEEDRKAKEFAQQVLECRKIEQERLAREDAEREAKRARRRNWPVNKTTLTEQDVAPTTPKKKRSRKKKTNTNRGNESASSTSPTTDIPPLDTTSFNTTDTEQFGGGGGFSGGGGGSEW